MTIINEKVKHSKFGVGVITEVKEQKISVQFEDNVGTKAFLYPEAFENFLKAENPIVENNALDELSAKQDQIEIERKEKERIANEMEETLKSQSVKKKPTKRITKKKV